EKVVRGGKHTAVMNVKAEVCMRCGERLYDEGTVRKFEEVRAKLARHETSGFQSMGTAFQVA
ncbi:MAG: YgiT-type zinc finger protein, partial [Bacteroidota bacterium]